MSLDQYSQTPASNDLANYFQTGMAPSKVKNAGWDIMADLASRLNAYTTGGGTANAQTLTQTRPFGALTAGLEVIYNPLNTNTGAATFAPDGLTAKNIFANGVAAIAGMIVAGVPAYLKYDGTQWQLLNPNASTGSFTLTLTGFPATVPSGTINYRIQADGKIATIWANAAITGTSNATSMTGTGVPAILSSANEHRIAFQCEDNGAYAPNARLGATNATTWVFYNGLTTATWTNPGVKGIILGAVGTYPLD